MAILWSHFITSHHPQWTMMVMIGYFCCILISLVVKTFTSPEAAEDMQGAVLFWCPCRVKLDWLVKWQKKNIACRNFKYVYRKYIATDLLKAAVKWKCLLKRGKVHVPSPSNVKIQTGFNKLLLLLHAMLFSFAAPVIDRLAVASSTSWSSAGLGENYHLVTRCQLNNVLEAVSQWEGPIWTWTRNPASAVLSALHCALDDKMGLPVIKHTAD